MTEEELEAILDVDKAAWEEEYKGVDELYAKFGDKLPKELADELASQGKTDVDQWGSDGSETHNIWKLYSAGDNYYYLASCVGDGGTYVLDVAGKKTANGTNIDIYQYNGGTNQQFMLTQNTDGSYKIRTRVTSEGSAVEIGDASTASGANAQQWEINGANCQEWTLERDQKPIAFLSVSGSSYKASISATSNSK